MKLNKIIRGAILAGLCAVCICTNVSAQTVVTPEGVKFDAEYYAANYPDVVKTCGDSYDALYRHYLEHGRDEGKWPSAEAKEDAEKQKAAEEKAVKDREQAQADMDEARHQKEKEAADAEKAAAAGTAAGSDSSSSGDFTGIGMYKDALKIYVGDSRTYVMRNAIGNDGSSWIGLCGTKCDTLTDTVAPLIDEQNLLNRKIIILYGINDLTAYGAKKTFDEYNAFLSTKAQEWIGKGASVYFASLIGIDDGMTEVCGMTQDQVKHVNEQVTLFNCMIDSLPANIHKIKLKVGKNPFYDGIHYTPETCRSIYNQINSQL